MQTFVLVLDGFKTIKPQRMIEFGVGINWAAGPQDNRIMSDLSMSSVTRTMGVICRFRSIWGGNSMNSSGSDTFLCAVVDEKPKKKKSI